MYSCMHPTVWKRTMESFLGFGNLDSLLVLDLLKAIDVQEQFPFDRRGAVHHLDYLASLIIHLYYFCLGVRNHLS